MIRSELCKIVGMKIPTFNSHRRNGDLPFKMGDGEAQDGEGRTWSNFTIHHAARMLAARNLADSHGVSWSQAAGIMRADGTICGPYGIGNHYFERDGIFVAQVEFANAKTNDAPVLFPRLKVYQGPLAKIIEAAEGEAEAYTKHRKGGEAAFGEEIRVTSVVAVDLSHSFKLARSIAAAEGIEVKFDDYRPEAE